MIEYVAFWTKWEDTNFKRLKEFLKLVNIPFYITSDDDRLYIQRDVFFEHKQLILLNFSDYISHWYLAKTVKLVSGDHTGLIQEVYDID